MEEIPGQKMSTPLMEEKFIDTNIFEAESDKKNKIEIKVLKSNINIIFEAEQKIF